MSAIIGLPNHGISVSIKTITNESLVTRARNHIADAFLENPVFTHLLFIDADISFSSEQIARMVKVNKDLVVGSYPHKAYDFTSIAELLRRNPNMDIKDIEPTILRYSGSMVAERKSVDENFAINEIDGFVKGWWDCPTGFMMIKRNVFEKMIDVMGKEISYINDLPQCSPDGLSVIVVPKKQHAFFNADVDPETRRYISEDYMFCKRWINRCKGEIYIDTKSTLSHTGTWTFKGDLMRYIKNNVFQVNAVTETMGQLVPEPMREKKE